MLDKLIRERLPFRLSRPLLFHRAQRYYHREVINSYTARDRELIALLDALAMPSTLLTGYQKSGNTWTRFMVANYFNMLLHPDVESTLTFDELYQVQSNRHEVNDLGPPPKGFPLFVYSHEPYRKVFDHFSTVAYVYRHPLDTLVSSYYFLSKREKPFPSLKLTAREKQRLMDIDAFVLRFILGWVLFHERTKRKADVVLCYERMKVDPAGQFAPLIERMAGSVDERTLERSIRASSFESVRKKQQQVERPQGHSSSDLKVPFTRSGETRQFERELKPSTIAKVRWFLRRYGIEEPE